MAGKPYKPIYNLNNPPLILDAAYDDAASINTILPTDVEVGTVAIVADDSGHRYILDPNHVWKPFVGSGGSGGGGEETLENWSEVAVGGMV